MKNILQILLAFICITFGSCKVDTSNNANGNSSKISKDIGYPAIAQKICDCVAPLAEVNKEVEFLVKADRKDEAMAMLKEIQIQKEKTDSCLKEIEKEYPDASVVESNKITSLLGKKCPNALDFLNGM